MLAYDLGNGAILTHNKQVCTHMSVWSHRPILGEHCILGTLDEFRGLSSSSCSSLLCLFVLWIVFIIITNIM